MIAQRDSGDYSSARPSQGRRAAAASNRPASTRATEPRTDRDGRFEAKELGFHAHARDTFMVRQEATAVDAMDCTCLIITD